MHKVHYEQLRKNMGLNLTDKKNQSKYWRMVHNAVCDGCFVYLQVVKKKVH